MKKIFKWTLFAVATLSLAACGTGAQKTNSQHKDRKSSLLHLTVKSRSLVRGQYIKPPTHE